MSKWEDRITAARLHEDQIRRLEQFVIRQVLGQFPQQQRTFTQGMLRSWVKLMGDDQKFDPDLAVSFAENLDGPLRRLYLGPIDRGDTLLGGSMVPAFRLGFEQALDFMDRTPTLVAPTTIPFASLSGRLSARYETASAQLSPSLVRVAGWDALIAGAHTIGQTEQQVETIVATELNAAQSEGATQATSTDSDKLRVWVAERDACLVCLAYQGQVARVGQPFPPRLTFGDRAPDDDPVANPPKHPNCRCDIQPIDPGDVQAITEGLKREARRSIVKGWSRPSESNASRLRAADRLLRAGAGLPKTVEAEGRKAVRDGKFKSRQVP